jgi:hypothetical protein
MNPGPNDAASGLLATRTRHLLILAAVIALASEARAQAGAVAQPAPPKTMASLMAEGYEMQDVRLFPDKIWMRKPAGGAVPFICDRGRIGSTAFDAYRNRKYDEISCSPAP